MGRINLLVPPENVAVGPFDPIYRKAFVPRLTRRHSGQNIGAVGIGRDRCHIDILKAAIRARIGTTSSESKLQPYAPAPVPLVYIRVEAKLVGYLSCSVSLTAAFNGIDTASPTVSQTMPGGGDQRNAGAHGNPGAEPSGSNAAALPRGKFLPLHRHGRLLGNVSVHQRSLLGGVGFHVDGVDNNYMFGSTGGSATVGPNPDAVEELSLLAQNYSAESGGHASQVKWRPRSGTNAFHGQLRALAVNPYLRAREFFEADTGAGYRTKMGGFQLSGPVVLPLIYNSRNRTFWFYDTEWTRSSWPYAENYTFPGDALRKGDFSSLPKERWPIDPATHQPFPDGRIPAGKPIQDLPQFIACPSAGQDLKSHLTEVCVRSEGLPDLKLAHHHETGAVSEGKILIVMVKEQTAGPPGAGLADPLPA